MNENELLEKIRIYQFCAVELNLYLDNFPNEENAVYDYKAVSKKLNECIMEYEKNYGPLTNFGSSYYANPQKWLSNPWPWENCNNRED
ncbi:spore coat protein CotJB [Clostridium sp. BJN0001]|uniref:spore coat protein CotJB n=1 Tax=Clostridium sp. BJN0001 TaxID=2930219 RepID=UPI001FD4F601|nr:spore coat protein CotJB [Clostridium sp. BJN0001]